MLLKSVQAAFLSSLTETELLVRNHMALNSSQFDPETIPARRRFLARRVKLLRNLLRWRKRTGEKFGVGELSTRLINNCIIPIAESGWEVGGEESVREVGRDGSCYSSRAYLYLLPDY